MPASAEDVVSMVLFARVVEERSFTGAAAKLGLSKSAVSAQLGRFEERLGARLLHRTTRRLTLTDAGLELYQRCAALAAQADEAAGLAQGLSQKPQGTLRVNAPTVLGSRCIAPLLGDFLRAHSQLKLELVAEDDFVDVTHGGFDMVIRIARKGQLGAQRTEAARRLAADRLVVCGSPEYLSARGRPETPEDLVGHQCLRYMHNSPHQEWRFERGGSAAYVPVPSRLSSNSGEVLRAAALAGEGMAILPRFMVADSLAAGALEEVLKDAGWPELGIWALFPERRQLPAKVRAFVDFLAVRLKRSLQA